jgi:hypothetical protein
VTGLAVALKSAADDLNAKSAVYEMSDDPTLTRPHVLYWVSFLCLVLDSLYISGVFVANTVLISNLPSCVDASALEDMFSSVGNVVNARIAYDTLTGKSMERGYVEMCSAEEVQNCILRFNGQTKSGRTLIVREDKPHVSQAPRVAVKFKRGSK